MNFTGKEFDSFREDLFEAMRRVCEKYQVKVKGSKITYGTVDFDLKLTFEKNEAGLPVERLKFEAVCGYHGFSVEDYLAVVNYKGSEYEFVGFKEGARKYKCLIRDIVTGDMFGITESTMHRLLEEAGLSCETVHEQTQQEPISQDEGVPTDVMRDFQSDDMKYLNLLTEQEQSVLRIKMGKNKRTERDWAQIKDILKGKDIFTYIPDPDCPAAECIDGMAVEDGFVMAFTDKTLLLNHLNVMNSMGMFRNNIVVVNNTFEEFLWRAKRNHLNILFDYEGVPNRCYLFFLSENDKLMAQYIV